MFTSKYWTHSSWWENYPFNHYDDSLSNGLTTLKEPFKKTINVAGFNKDNLDLSYRYDNNGMTIVISGENKELELSIEKEVIVPYNNVKLDSAKVVDGLLVLRFSPEEPEQKKIQIE